MPVSVSTQIAGKDLTIETGKLALQANGAVTVRYGDTVVLATAVLSDNARPDVSHFPLMVDYEEKLYAGGKIKGSRFIKREGRPSDEAVLTARVIDRSLRPLFPQQIREDIQVIVTVLSYDGENDPEVPGLIAAVAAVAISDIPMEVIVGAVRVGRIGGEWVINPTVTAQAKSDLDLFVTASLEKTIMIEAGAKEVNEEDMLQAIQFARKHIRPAITLVEDLAKQVSKEKRTFETPELPAELKTRLQTESQPVFEEILFSEAKADRKGGLKKFIKEMVKKLAEEDAKLDKSLVGNELYAMAERFISDKIIATEKRPGGRALTEIRALSAEVAALPRTHGTGYFMRGETQVLTVATLGAPGDQQIVDGMKVEYKKRFMHHYNFPPYSVGEVKPLRGPSRRDIGHGALAEKALEPMLPDKEAFPYTIRLVSEVFGSNGSSSMASTCGSTLALMDAGVPIKRPVAGIAMGLVSDEKGNWKVLTDLQDLEDAEGGMDFKIAGSREGITAIQLDTKTHGLSDEVVAQTLTQAKAARLEILAVMTKAIAEPRADLSPYAPRITVIRIDPEQIGTVIGPAGKQINEIIDTTGVDSIDIEDDGLVMITSLNAEGAKKAEQWIKDLTRDIAIGETFKGKVVRIMNFGAFVELLPGKDGMIHISKLAKVRVGEVTDVVNIGDEVEVKVIEVDEMGRTNLALISKGGVAVEDLDIKPSEDRGPRRPGGFNDRGPR